MKTKLLAAAGLICTQAAFAQEKPNIIFILADDMGYGDVSVDNPYSRIHTPAIDRLASEGIRFTDAHAAGALSTPSRYGLITGRYFFRAPKSNGAWGYLQPHIEPDRTTLADLLQATGYTTACIGKWHLGLNWQKDGQKVDFSQPVTGGPNDLGFSYSFILPGSLDMPPYVFMRNQRAIDSEIVQTGDVYPHTLNKTVEAWDRKYTKDSDIYWERGIWWRNGEMSASFKVEECMDRIVDEGIAFIDREGSQSNPFFLYLPLTGPHTPWMPNDKFKGSSELGPFGDFVNQIDDVVARIVAKVNELGIADNTMIVFASDNGSAWNEEDNLQYVHHSNYGRRGMKGDAYDGGHHIPLIIKWPAKVHPGNTYAHPVCLLDFFATFAQMTQQTVTENTAEDSFSFLDVLYGSQAPYRPFILYLSAAGKLAIRSGAWKLIEGLGSGGFTAPAKLKPVPNGPTDQLYNVQEDTLETYNMFLQRPDLVRQLQSLLETQIKL